MAGFQTQMGEMRPWFGKRYQFQPKEDLSAFELAQVLLLIANQAGSASIASWLDLPDGIPAPLDRHFVVQEY